MFEDAALRTNGRDRLVLTALCWTAPDATIHLRKFRKCGTQSFIQRAAVFVLGSPPAIWIGIGFELKTSSRAPLQWSEAKTEFILAPFLRVFL